MTTEPIVLAEAAWEGDNADEIEIIAGARYQSWVPNLDAVELRSVTGSEVVLHRGDRLVLSVVRHDEDDQAFDPTAGGMEVARITIRKTITDDDVIVSVDKEDEQGEELPLLDALGMIEMAKDSILRFPEGGPE